MEKDSSKDNTCTLNGVSYHRGDSLRPTPAERHRELMSFRMGCVAVVVVCLIALALL